MKLKNGFSCTILFVFFQDGRIEKNKNLDALNENKQIAELCSASFKGQQRKMKSITSLNPRRILVRSTNWIGDAIMTTPAVRTIRQNFPDAKIFILANPWVADVFAASPHVDEIIYYYKKDKHAGLKGKWWLGRELAEYNFDMAILLQNAFDAALLALLAGIPVRAGYKRDVRSLLLTHPVKIRKEIRKGHQVHYYQTLLKDLGLQCGSDELFLRLPEKAVNWAKDYVGKLGNKPIIGLNPGAAHGPAKCWPAGRYGELAGRLAKKYDAALLVFGTGGDSETAATIASYAPDHVVDLAGKTSLAEAMALIGLCTAFVTNDSGLMHVAAAQKTPLVGIFGSTDLRTGPFSDNAISIKKDLPCSPCFDANCKTDFRCMMDITVDEVYAAVEKIV